ncbi:cysteine dioxygenase [Paenibacillus aestuarii]|uniref:Cysteine dioxygenase n=1 Tax=Paenibacillus aestuarii TaxID=516965 RepID=A0ABW0K4D8_9BACL|nr:cysteine dioxygenase family protein [Paenibacillus aestuarii]
MTFLKAIEQTFCKLQQPTLEDLKAALTALGPNLQHVPAYKTEPAHLPYGRNVIYGNDQIEVIVIHIPANRSTAIHNHGASIGCAYLAEGSLVNTTHVLDEHGYPKPQKDDFIQAGQLFVAPADQIHQLSNPFPERAISLHVYSPPLRNTNRYLPYTDVLDYVI